VGRGVLIRPSKVKPYIDGEYYESRMLLDDKNSESQKTQINQGILKKGGKFNINRHMGFDETYVIQKGKCTLQVDDEIMDIEEGDIIFIPAGVPHALDNTKGETELVLLTIWPGTPPKGVSGVYDRRMAEWGKSYVLVEEK
jgi:mannose-6-phosphate isomerase-like protein (cupin superfamily)